MTQNFSETEIADYNALAAVRYPRVLKELAVVNPPKEKRTRKAKRLPEYLSPNRVELLMLRCEDHVARLGMLIQWRAGLRASEALALLFEDSGIDVLDVMAVGILKVRQGKGKKQRMVPLHPELGAAIRTALSFTKARQGDRVVPMGYKTYQRRVKAAAEAAGLPKYVSTHTLRHSFAMHCVANRISIPKLQYVLGHAHIQTTFVYLQMTPDVEGEIARLP